jgi:hypothetical protein
VSVALTSSRTLLRTAGANPDSSVLISYIPGSRPGMEYWPSTLLTWYAPRRC